MLYLQCFYCKVIHAEEHRLVFLRDTITNANSLEHILHLGFCSQMDH
jgi:hypothetical protein